MGRFTNELRGEYGIYWKQDAEQRLEEMEIALYKGDIVIDDNEVARNKIGRALMEDRMEILSFTDWHFSETATREARAKEVAESVAEYKKNQSAPSDEEMYEMRAAFGAGAVIVDIITGKEIKL